MPHIEVKKKRVKSWTVIMSSKNMVMFTNTSSKYGVKYDKSVNAQR